MGLFLGFLFCFFLFVVVGFLGGVFFGGWVFLVCFICYCCCSPIKKCLTLIQLLINFPPEILLRLTRLSPRILVNCLHFQFSFN